jgi:trimeric autotransporter adhesin
MCCVSLSASSQTAVSATGDGGFETGTTFAANGWTAINPATVIHQWLIGTAAFNGGVRGAYVSNNGSAYAYSPTGGARTCHFYRDVTIPAGASSITLSFYWKGTGELGADRMLVYTAPTTVTPAANVPVSPVTTITGATLEWTQSATAASYTLATVSLSPSLSGTTFRLIFTWQNNASAGSTVPAAVDDISVTYVCPSNGPITGGSVVCSGNTTSLSSPATGGTWSSSNTAVGTISTLGVVTALSPGTTTISYATGSCAPPATMVVTVIATPSPISGPSRVCLGSSITLTDTAAGGAWSSTAPSVVSVVSTTGVATGAALGTATIIYSNGCGSPVTYIVTVDPLPPAITGPDHVCEAGTPGSITLSNASMGGTWSSVPTPNVSVSTAGPFTGLVTGMADGTATIIYTSTLGCIATYTVTVDPFPDPIVGVGPMCIGNSIVLADPLPGGVWSSTYTGIADITSTGVVTGLSGGTSTISYTNGCGSATVIVTVDPFPTPITGYDTVCVGGNTSFADLVFGGTWSSSYTTVATVTSSSGLISGVSTGISFITYTMPGGCYVIRTINVIDAPSPITGPSEVCPGAVISLSYPGTGGHWLSLNPTAASINSSTGLVTGIIPDVASIRYTTPQGCFAYTSVTVNPRPDPIVSRDTFCATDLDTAYDATPAGTWSSLTPGVFSINSANGLITTIGGGTGTIKYTLPTTCFITKSIVVNPLPMPVVSFNYTTIQFETTPGYSSYQWYHSVFGILPGATTRTVAGALAGNYTVEVSDSNGCVNTSAPAPFAIWMGVGGSQLNQNVNIFPNPATNIVYVDAGKEVKAVISSVDGKTLIEQPNARAVNISSLPSGVYLLSLFDNDGLKIAVEKLTKQ